MSETLYTREILRLAVSIPNEGRLDNPDGTAECRSKTCGSRVVVDVILSSEGKVSDFGFKVNACALGQASAAILGTQATGKSLAELNEMKDGLAAFLAGENEDVGDWPNLHHLETARDHKGRHAAILLPFDAMIDAIKAAQSKAKAA